MGWWDAVKTIGTGGVNKIASDPWGTVESAATGGMVDVFNTTPVGGWVGSGVGKVAGIGEQVGGSVGGTVGGGGGGASYDAQKYLDIAQQQSGDVYSQALARAQAGGPTFNQVVAPTIERGPGVSAERISAPGTVAGQEAADFRAQMLSSAERARTAPSAAAGQMRAGLGQTASAALAQAGAARGADRASARRDAMLATTMGGVQAAGTTAALEAQERAGRESAYAQTLAGVRAGDVTAGGLDLEAQRYNQAAALQAGTTGAQLGFNYAQLEAQQRLEAERANQEAGLKAYQLQNQAGLGYLGAATQAAGAGTQAADVARTYATEKEKAETQRQGGLVSAGGALLGTVLSDISVKRNVGTFADGYNKQLQDAYGMQPAQDPYGGIPQGQDFLAWKPEQSEDAEKKGLLESILSDEDAKEYVDRMMHSARSPSERRKSAEEKAASEPSESTRSAATAAGREEMAYLLNRADFTDVADEPEKTKLYAKLVGATVSDEEAKQEVEKMGKEDRIEWARKIEPITFRYKPGISDEDDGGAHAGVSAQQVEGTGPLGKLMVHRDPYSGLRKVDTLALPFMVGKAALDRADEAVAIAKGKKGGK